MTLSELHDLQSRLMLFAGQAEVGNDDVTKFIDLLSNVETLAKAYVKLKLSGCLLFSHWIAKLKYLISMKKFNKNKLLLQKQFLIFYLIGVGYYYYSYLIKNTW